MIPRLKKNFASDNNAGVHPAVIRAISSANQGHAVGYGDDPYTQEALRLFKKNFGPRSETYLVFNGTAANVLGLQALTRPHEAVICSELAHIQMDECGAPERHLGVKLIPVHAPHGKLTVESISLHLHGVGDTHHVQPRVISITQSTELGTVYTREEVRRLATFAHSHGMYLHMDGARLANAAASLRVSLKAITADCGVDVLSFGGTKNGIMGGEAIVIFRKELARDFKFARKQGMQLASKMRFISAQFIALLSNEGGAPLWLKNARHANAMALLLAKEVGKIPALRVVQAVQANGVFVRMPMAAIPKLQKKRFFYVWNPDEGVVRWMTSFDTTPADVRGFIADVRSHL